MITADELLGKTVIPVLVKPSSPKTKILGVRNECLHIALRAPPQEGKANAELTRFLNRTTNKRCEIISGVSSKKKLVKCL